MPELTAAARPIHGLHHFAWRCRDDMAALRSPNTPAWVNHIALRVASGDDLLVMKSRLEAAGVEVLGVTDHDDYIHSIYFFAPNGLRLELSVEVAPREVVEGFAHDAHAELAAWTSEKPARR